jgi:hypothetical protein
VCRARVGQIVRHITDARRMILTQPIPMSSMKMTVKMHSVLSPSTTTTRERLGLNSNFCFLNADPSLYPPLQKRNGDVLTREIRGECFRKIDGGETCQCSTIEENSSKIFWTIRGNTKILR